MKFLEEFVQSPYPSIDEEEASYSDELKKACITANGKLMSRYKNLINKKEQKENFGLLRKTSDFKYQYFMDIKLKGMLFDQGVFNTLLEKCKDCSQTTNYIQVGENAECESIAYLKLLFKTQEQHRNAVSVLENLKSEKVSYWIVKSNLS